MDKTVKNNDELIRDLELYCGDESNNHSALSIDVLREKISHIPQAVLACSHFFHELCRKKNVTFEMVELVLRYNPYAAYFCSNRYHGITYDKEDLERREAGKNEGSLYAPESAKICSDRVYPIHLACNNSNCPNSVVQLLATSNPTALRHLCILDDGIYEDSDDCVEGLPLHYYFHRHTNMDLDTVKHLIELYPDSLTTSGEEIECFPIHVLMENQEVGNFSDIVKYIIKVNPSSLECTDVYYQVALHVACYSNCITANIVQMLVDGWKDSTHQKDCHNSLPIHQLCENRRLDDSVKLNVLRILIGANPDSLHVRDGKDSLPIHIASRFQCPAFCKILVEHCPNSLSLRDPSGYLPLHLACKECRSPEIVKYMLKIYPQATTVKTHSGYYPLHLAASVGKFDAPTTESQFDVMKYLLRIDPDSASKSYVPEDGTERQYLPLHLACQYWSAIGAVRLLFDAYPNAIYNSGGLGGRDPAGLAQASGHYEAASFLEQQSHVLSSLEDSAPNLSFPIHHAMRTNVTLGVIKLLSERLPGQEQVADDNGLIPLHIACELGKIETVEYFLKANKEGVSALDRSRNSPLHLACLGGKCDIVNCLLEVNPSSVSEQNCDDKLPIELLLEADCEQDGIEYTEAIWRLLVAYPETVQAWFSRIPSGTILLSN